jgi:hypothetical protein
MSSLSFIHETFVANMMGIRRILRVLNTAAVSLNPG